jgi:lipopolysaccharide transport system permease protein
MTKKSFIQKTSALSTFLDQVSATTHANLILRYRQSFSGFIWVILHPILMFGAQSLAFNKILKLGISNFYIFLLTGLLPWLFMIQSLEMSSTIIINNARITKSYPVNPLVFVFAQVIDNFINFLAALLAIGSVVYFSHGFSAGRALWLPLAALPLLSGTVAVATLLSVGNVFFRDLKFVISFALSVSFFLTPIFYPETFLPEDYRWLINFNFLYILLKPVRSLFLESDLMFFWSDLMIADLTAVVLAALAIFIWKRYRNLVHFYV